MILFLNEPQQHTNDLFLLFFFFLLLAQITGSIVAFNEIKLRVIYYSTFSLTSFHTSESKMRPQCVFFCPLPSKSSVSDYDYRQKLSGCFYLLQSGLELRRQWSILMFKWTDCCQMNSNHWSRTLKFHIHFVLWCNHLTPSKCYSLLMTSMTRPVWQNSDGLAVRLSSKNMSFWICIIIVIFVIFYWLIFG